MTSRMRSAACLGVIWGASSARAIRACCSATRCLTASLTTPAAAGQLSRAHYVTVLCPSNGMDRAAEELMGIGEPQMSEDL